MTPRRVFSALWSILPLVISLVAVGAILIPIFLESTPWPVEARNHLEDQGVAESGAQNLVSAVYLGYRAFDTLGETIVLLVAVSGTIGIIARAKGALAKGFDREDKGSPVPAVALAAGTTSLSAPPPRLRRAKTRTDLLEVVTGKLGPVVLVFGFYVMLYGHLSPGGGFQGGVVIASGIVFLALGGKEGASTRLTEAGVLARLEAMAFFFLVLAAFLGMFMGSGFFTNFLAGVGLPSVGFIILLNIIIGLKVGAGIGFMGIAMLSRVEGAKGEEVNHD
ncbi:MAG: hypothetical protein GW949_03910 [Spirochaetales bacterium]|nr:hypothetical protein [Spirochaetales bacterium]